MITPDLFEPSLEHFRMPEYACAVVEEELGQSCHTVALYEGTIFQSKIAEWSYYLGCVSAAVESFTGHCAAAKSSPVQPADSEREHDAISLRK